MMSRTARFPIFVSRAARCAVFAAALACTTTVSAVTVEAVRIDGTTVAGEWAGVVDGDRVKLDTSAGARSLQLDDLSVIAFDNQEEPPTGEIRVFLADGGLIHGELVREGQDAIVVRCALGDALTLPFDVLAGIRLAGEGGNKVAAASFLQAMNDRRPGEDVFIVRDAEGAKSLRGRLEKLGPEGGAFVFGGRSHSFQPDKAYGVVFATGAAAPKAGPVMPTLVDGTTFSGHARPGDTGAFRIETSFGAELEIEPARLSRIRVQSDRVVYLSDLSAAGVQTEGRLHRPWPIRHDQSLTLGTLATGGRNFEKGLGVHSRTELTYDLAGRYEKFAATVGIDDAVRPRGSVVVRVLGDGELLYESDNLTGVDPPVDVLADVSNAQKLTLVVDFADELDLGDQVVVGAARLLRPAQRFTADE